MSLNVNTALYNQKGIDLASVNNVSSKILKSASEAQPEVKAIDYSKFNRNSLGVDLYSSRTTPELQKQIALTQAGLYAQAIDVAKLNSAAAMNLYSAATVQKNVEMTQSVLAGGELVTPSKAEDTQNVIKLFNTQDKNPNSHNGFNPFKSGKERTAKEENELDILDFII